MAEESNLKRRCKQETCTVSKDGICLESLEPDKCPHHFYLESDVEEVKNQEQTIDEATSKWIKLFSGMALTASQITLITNQFDCKKIFIVGESGSGKTTLLATIYDLFQIGPINDIVFAGSFTQPGFEERCHLSRVVSKAAIPDTEKTNTKEFNFLHLAVKKMSQLKETAAHLLISDISGERLQLARDSSNAIADLSLLKIASSIIYIIDGEKLYNKKLRQAALFNANTFIRRALDEGGFTLKTDLKIIISKWDMLNNDESFDFETLVKIHMSDQFAHRVKKISFSKIAARPVPVSDEITFGFGIYDLLNSWIKQPEELNEQKNPTKLIKSNRSFNNFINSDNYEQ